MRVNFYRLGLGMTDNVRHGFVHYREDVTGTNGRESLTSQHVQLQRRMVGHGGQRREGAGHAGDCRAGSTGILAALVLLEHVERKASMATKVTEQTWDAEVIKSDKPVIVDFWAEWCGPCRLVAPEIEKLASKYAGSVEVVKVDVDANPMIAARYGIMSIPTVAYFKAGEAPRGCHGVGRMTLIAGFVVALHAVGWVDCREIFA